MSKKPAKKKTSWRQKLQQWLRQLPKDKDELMQVLTDAKQRGLIDGDDLLMIEGVLHVSEVKVRDAMIPRAQMTVIEQNENIENILPIIIENGHSRFPVIAESRDEIVGILLAKDLLRGFQTEKGPQTKIKKFLRPATIIPESKRLDSLLNDFKKSRNHMAIVLDEYGSVCGLITIEDVLEQIVGNIDDEYDIENETPNIVRHRSGTFHVNGLTPIREFNEFFSTKLSETQFDTISGLVLLELGHFPKAGEKLMLGNCGITILEAEEKQIHRLEVKCKKAPGDNKKNNNSRKKRSQK